MATKAKDKPKADPATNPGQLPKPTPGAGLALRDGLGAEVSRSAETSSSAAAEHAKAMIQAKFTVAMARPRNIMGVRTRLLEHCARPRFAEASRYVIPRGGRHITGWSIRFAEAALREFRRVRPTHSSDDPETR